MLKGNTKSGRRYMQNIYLKRCVSVNIKKKTLAIKQKNETKIWIVHKTEYANSQQAYESIISHQGNVIRFS